MRRLPKLPMLLISAVQGLLLYGLYHATDSNYWPSETPVWSFPLWTVALAIPLLLLLSITRDNFKRAATQVGIFGGVLALLAAYVGYQAEPFREFPIYSLIFPYICATALACFKAIMYIQQRADQVELTYPVLFTNSWRNFLVTALSGIFVLVFFLILTLWGQLFRVIEIDFFLELFREDWFLFPTLSVAFGTGIIMFRDLTKVIDNITRLLHWLFKLLLPLILGIAAIFIASLPVVGLDVLWSTGRGTALLLALLAITLFCTNAVYQDGRETEPYPCFVHRIIYAGLCFMPIVSVLSLYGLVLRLNQYGWSVERCWAFVVWLIFSLFAVGYFVGIVRRRDAWTENLAQVNKAMGLVVLVIMLLANSPLLDFRKISLASQIQRVESGEVEWKDFDFWYVKQNLARPGYLAMEKLKNDIGDDDPDLLALIESPVFVSRGRQLTTPDEFWDSMHYRTTDIDIDPKLRALIYQTMGQQPRSSPTLVEIDIDLDGQSEYVLLTSQENRYVYGQIYYLEDAAWRNNYLQVMPMNQIDDAVELIRNGEIKIVEPRFKNIEVGGITLRPNR